MTVFSITTRHVVSTRFDGTYPSPHGKAARHLFSFSRLSLKRRMLPLVSGIGILAFFGILVIGVSSIKLLFEIQSAKRELSALTKENEELRLQATAKNSPEKLLKEAGVLQLSEATNIRYVTFERNVLAGAEHPAP